MLSSKKYINYTNTPCSLDWQWGIKVVDHPIYEYKLATNLWFILEYKAYNVTVTPVLPTCSVDMNLFTNVNGEWLMRSDDTIGTYEGKRKYCQDRCAEPWIPSEPASHDFFMAISIMSMKLHNSNNNFLLYCLHAWIGTRYTGTLYQGGKNIQSPKFGSASSQIAE